MARLIFKAYRASLQKKVSPYAIAEEIGVQHPAILRATGKRIGGLFQEVKGTGSFDRKRFRITVRKGTSARGRELQRGREQADVQATAAGVKQAVRRLRGQEAERIDAIDERIENLRVQIDAARDEREELVRRAWAAGNVVRLAEMQEWAAEQEAENQRIREERAGRPECEECGSPVDGGGRCEVCGAVQG